MCWSETSFQGTLHTCLEGTHERQRAESWNRQLAGRNGPGKGAQPSVGARSQEGGGTCPCGLNSEEPLTWSRLWDVPGTFTFVFSFHLYLRRSMTDTILILLNEETET